MQKLSELSIGEVGYIVKVHGYGGFRKRIVEMGFIKGQPVKVANIAPLGDPITYNIMGYDVSLRKSVAEQIDIISPQQAKIELAKDIDNQYNGTITEEDFRRVALDKRREITVALVGNPNAGKSTLFNAFTGKHVKVGNYSGVTVDVKTGTAEYKGYKFNFTDLPGTYSISAFSPEERLVREHIVTQKPDVVLNVIDSGNLERNLYLTTQIIDMNVSSIIAFNFYDEFTRRGDKIDLDALAKLIGIPIVPTSAANGMGIEELFESIIKLYEGADIIDRDGKLLPSIDDDKLIERYHHLVELEHRHQNNSDNQDLMSCHQLHSIVRHIHINYGNIIEEAIADIKSVFAINEGAYDSFTPRYVAIQLLQGDKEIAGLVARFTNYGEVLEICNKYVAQIEAEFKDSPQNVVMDAKYAFIAGALKETYCPAEKSEATTPTSKIDRIVTNKYLAYPIFALIIFLMFEATFTLGAYPMDWIEQGVGVLSDWISSLIPEGILKDLVVDGIIGGVGAVIVFLPNILILYFCMTLLDASGYMARASFIMDKLMHKIGLHGKSFIPLMMGFGCSVPAIMATRTIENRNSRMITILISSFMSCSARLPVYILIIGLFFAKYQALVMFGLYFLGIIIASLFSIIFKKYIFTKEEYPFVMELPVYRMPQMKYVLRDTWEKGAQYMRKIGTTILVGSILIWALAYFPNIKTQNPQDKMEHSYLATIGKGIEPILSPLGFDWKMSISILTGATAKEVVVSTLGVLYNVDEDDIDTSLSAKIKSATYSDGTPIYTPASAISLLIFILLYFPCIAAVATVKKETESWLWTIFMVVYTTLFAWLMAFVSYNIISHGLIQELLVGMSVLLSFIFVGKRIFIKKNKKSHCNNCNQC